MFCGRYAPSPTGRLHLGNLRTALLAWLQVRLSGGRLILRIDDLDLERNRPGALEQCLDDLRWLGLDWDEGPDNPGLSGRCLQSDRTALYQEAFDRLRQQGVVYPCRCSRKDIARAQSAPHAPTGIYPGSCRPGRGKTPSTTDSDCAWRFLVQDREIGFEDQLLGFCRENLARDTGDFVVLRRDGHFAYQLASVVDDALMGVTDVLRGADLASSTARQIALFEALGYSPPRFWHVPLLCDSSNRRMSKRDGSDSLEQWVAEGKSARQLVAWLAHSAGLIEETEPVSAQSLLQDLDPGKFTAALRTASPQNP